jgi:hypothetical protein
MNCIGCNKRITFEDVRPLLKALTRDEKASLRGYLSAQLQDDIQPRHKQQKLPCIQCQSRFEVNPGYLRSAVETLPIVFKKSIVGSLSAQLRVTIGRQGGHPFSVLKRCPCGLMSLRRALSRRECVRLPDGSFECQHPRRTRADREGEDGHQSSPAL